MAAPGITLDFGYLWLLEDVHHDLMEDVKLVFERKYLRKEAQAGIEATMIAALISTVLFGIRIDFCRIKTTIKTYFKMSTIQQYHRVSGLCSSRAL